MRKAKGRVYRSLQELPSIARAKTLYFGLRRKGTKLVASVLIKNFSVIRLSSCFLTSEYEVERAVGYAVITN